MITAQQKKLDDFEDRSRRRNLVVFGLPESDRESASSLKYAITEDLIRVKLGLSVSTVERVHRIGKKRSDKPRPVIMNFFDYNEKLRVLHDSFKLKGSTISVRHDFCAATLKKRSKLWQHGKQFKAKGHKVSLDYEGLRVDDTVYVWDEATSQPVMLPRTNLPRAGP